ncbi:MAG: FAD-dependent oxidoreductase [Actinomycetaceae bacterium]|nr:FAD-dependent oxidoreductase [Actinomycetaceae bacterium]
MASEEEYDFDVIVVGGGIAGGVCAYQLAKAGCDVALIERAEISGSKNLSGGVFYCSVLEDVFPHFFDEAPIERVITRNKVVFLNESSSVGLDYWDSRLAKPVNAVTVLRAHLDAWILEQCEDAGVSVVPGFKVDRLLRADGDSGAIVGVVAAGEEMRSRVVVLADGVNSFLARDAGMRDKPQSQYVGVGVKSVFRIGEQSVRDRFHLSGNEGAAYSYIGDATCGVSGGGFVYSNKDSVSVGVVVRLDALEKSQMSSSDIHDHFVNHPDVRPFIEGGELLEYGAHLVNEGGVHVARPYVSDGCIVIGDAAGFMLNTGFTIRGMDLAAQTGILAAQAIEKAIEKRDYSSAALDVYRDFYEKSWLADDMNTYAKAPDFLDSSLLYDGVGRFASEFLYSVYRHDGSPRRHIGVLIRENLKKSKVRLRDLLRLAWRGGKDI